MRFFQGGWRFLEKYTRKKLIPQEDNDGKPGWQALLNYLFAGEQSFSSGKSQLNPLDGTLRVQ